MVSKVEPNLALSAFIFQTSSIDQPQFEYNILMQKKIHFILTDFRIPTIIILGILVYLILHLFHYSLWGNAVAIAVTVLGAYGLITESVSSLIKKQFALDYIAILAIVVGLITGEYLVASVIALMIATGETLESYGVKQARASLTKLVNRIPQDVLLWEGGKAARKEKIGTIKIGTEIFIRKGEAIPLDGVLVSQTGLTDESSLTGEPYFIEKIKGDTIRSGTINAGDSIALRVTKEEKDSTYRKIVTMVKEAQGEKAPLIRLADRYSTYFTVVTLIITAFAYVYQGGLTGALAVLVIATPCPLIIATPIALLGGVNAAAKKRIIVKKLASLEVLARVTTFVLDKTGTITLGHPTVTNIVLKNTDLSRKEILMIAEAIERNSLHPLAKAIVEKAKEEKVPLRQAEAVSESIGSGIEGTVNGRRYSLKKVSGYDKPGMAVSLKQGNTLIAEFIFTDEIKKDSQRIIRRFIDQGYSLLILTGDKKAAAEDVKRQIDERIAVRAELTPEEKKGELERLQKSGTTVAMIGDGINDAPALALADVGIVFSNQEQTAASEAADIVLLGGDFLLVQKTQEIAKRTINIAIQSIRWGIGISILGMILASIGLIPPLLGAGLQEAIDVAVILNALRAARS